MTNGGCHVETQDWATWHHTIHPYNLPRVKNGFDQLFPDVSTQSASGPRQPMPTVPTMSSCATCHTLNRPPVPVKSAPMHPSMSVVWPYVLYSKLPRQHCTDCTVNIFACLTKITDHNIFLIRCLFEPIQVAVGLCGRCLHTCIFWSHFEHSDF